MSFDSYSVTNLRVVDSYCVVTSGVRELFYGLPMQADAQERPSFGLFRRAKHAELNRGVHFYFVSLVCPHTVQVSIPYPLIPLSPFPTRSVKKTYLR